MFKCFYKSNGLIAIAFCILSSSSKAQVNLVPNPGFEKLDSCVAQFQNAFTWPYMQIELASPWDSLRNGGGSAGAAPILMNSCFNPNSNIGVPKNLGNASGCTTLTGSYQIPHSGKGYLYQEFFKQSPSNVAWRTYAQSVLTNTLIAGKSYCVTFYVSLSNRATIAIDELSAYFDDGTIQSVAPMKEAITSAQIKSPSGVFYMDTLNWMKVQGTFTATGNESYITIGNFLAPASVNYTTFCGPNGVAEYYVDDVSVIDYNLPSFAGANQTITVGDSAFIGRPPEIGLECTWTTGTTTIGTGGGLWVKPVATTTYIVTQNICGNIKTDTVVINVSGVGIKELSSGIKKTILSPNPNSGEFEISGLNIYKGKKIEIEIYDVSGKLIYNETKTPMENNVKLNLDLANGIYLVKVKLSDGSVDVHRLIISK